MSRPIIDVGGKRPLAPRVDAFSLPFWGALDRGEFRGTRCADCGRASFPPRRLCPGCGASNPRWFEFAGGGTLYSRTVVHAAPAIFAAEVPYTLGIVDLDEDVRLLTRVLETDARVMPDQRVEIVVLRYEDGCLFAARATTQNATESV